MNPSRSSGKASTFRTESSSSTSRIVGAGSVMRCRRRNARIALQWRRTVTPARRRRARRGSLERPVNARLYRSSFLFLSLPLLILAFSIVRAGPLPAPLLPPNFDGGATRQLAADFATSFPDRSPGGPAAVRAAQWFRDQMAPYGLPVATDTWQQDIAGLGTVRLRNVWAVAAGQSPRGDRRDGAPRRHRASGRGRTTTRPERRRSSSSRATTRQAAGGRVRSAHTIVFLSTDGGAFGGFGAVRFSEHSPFRVVATINLDGIGGRDSPRVVITGDTPRSPAATFVQTAARRVLEQAGVEPRRASILDQLIDLGFPFTLYEQGPFVARGVPAVTLTTAGERPPGAFADRASQLSTPRLTALGRAAQQTIGSLDQGLELAQGTTTFVWAGARIVRGWAIELVLFALLVPFLVGAVDLFAHCRRRRIPIVPAVRSLRTRVAFWLFVGLAFYVFRFFGAWPSGAPRPPSPALDGRRRLARDRAARARRGGAPRLGGRPAAAGAAASRRRRREPRRRDGCAPRLRRRLVARPGNEPVRAHLRIARRARLAVAAAGAQRRGARPRAPPPGRARRAAAPPALVRVAFRARLRRALVPPGARRPRLRPAA